MRKLWQSSGHEECHKLECFQPLGCLLDCYEVMAKENKLLHLVCLKKICLEAGADAEGKSHIWDHKGS